MAITVTVHGASGRMGRLLMALLGETEGLQLVSLWECEGHPALGTEIGGAGLPLTRAWEAEAGEVIIDFSLPRGLSQLLATWPGDCQSALLSGTTGLSSETAAALTLLGGRVPVFYAANMSQGIHVLRMLARCAAQLLDGDWDVEILEMHHKRKADAPSGTAMALVKTIQDAWPQPLTPVTGREGQCGPREAGELGLFALRGGSVVGEHELVFAGPDETVRISHRAESRELFARGALKAARWLAKQPAGYYGMDDLAGSQGR
jgi:4-hydroxy-tetrahydrodipicolinate reductase